MQDLCRRFVAMKSKPKLFRSILMSAGVIAALLVACQQQSVQPTENFQKQNTDALSAASGDTVIVDRFDGYFSPGGIITLEWVTILEENNVGFHVWRSTTEQENYQCLTKVLIPSFEYQEYAFNDSSCVLGTSYYYKIEAVLASGASLFFGPIWVNAAREVEPAIPTEFSLSQNYPNPFNGTTFIVFSLAQQTPVTLVVYTLFHEEVCTLVSGVYFAGMYQVMWNGQNSKGELVSPGLYQYQLKAGNFESAKSMLLVRE
jgi:hypothetical protein